MADYIRPEFGRLDAALHVAAQFPADWLYDPKVFYAESEERDKQIVGNVIGFIAWRIDRPALRLNSLAMGIGLATTKMLGDCMAMPEKLKGSRLHMRWKTATVSCTQASLETFGWNAVCEYFQIGMWDARRTFSGYGDPNPETVERCLERIGRFIQNRRAEHVERMARVDA